MKYLIILILQLSLWSDVYVVGSIQLPIKSLNSQQLRDLFLKENEFVQEYHLVPLNLDTKSAVRKVFEDKILEMNRDDLNEYWIEQHYYGKNAPKVISNEKKLILYLNSISNAIGYMSKFPSQEQNLKVLFEIKE